MLAPTDYARARLVPVSWWEWGGRFPAGLESRDHPEPHPGPACGGRGVWKLFPGTGHRRSAACVPLCCLAGDLYTQAAEAATEAMKGRLATQYYEKAEEAWAQMEE